MLSLYTITSGVTLEWMPTGVEPTQGDEISKGYFRWVVFQVGTFQHATEE